MLFKEFETIPKNKNAVISGLLASQNYGKTYLLGYWGSNPNIQEPESCALPIWLYPSNNHPYEN